MNDIFTLGNRPLADELAHIREKIKTLRAHEDALKDIINEQMREASSLGGDEYIACRGIMKRKGPLDIDQMEADGIDIEAYRKPDTVVHVIRIERREREAA